MTSVWTQDGRLLDLGGIRSMRTMDGRVVVVMQDSSHETIAEGQDEALLSHMKRLSEETTQARPCSVHGTPMKHVDTVEGYAAKPVDHGTGWTLLYLCERCEQEGLPSSSTPGRYQFLVECPPT